MSKQRSSGQMIGQYELLDVLGQGGMATVYRGQHQTNGQLVAIKIMSTALAGQQTFVDRFVREAQVVESLQHPHILPVYEHGRHKHFFYMVLKLIEGGSMDARIAGKPLPFGDVERYVKQIADALDYAHARKIIHRDLKPANVLLDGDNNTFLMDFGIAKVADQQLTSTGQLVGTPAYMSPEQWRATPIDPRADVYSLGIMTFEFFTGRTPFNAQTPHQMMYAHMSERVPFISQMIPNFPEEIDKVIMRATAKETKRRYQTAGEFSVALSEALHILETRAAKTKAELQATVVDSTVVVAVDEGARGSASRRHIEDALVDLEFDDKPVARAARLSDVLGTKKETPPPARAVQPEALLGDDVRAELAPRPPLMNKLYADLESPSSTPEAKKHLGDVLEGAKKTPLDLDQQLEISEAWEAADGVVTSQEVVGTTDYSQMSLKDLLVAVKSRGSDNYGEAVGGEAREKSNPLAGLMNSILSGLESADERRFLTPKFESVIARRRHQGYLGVQTQLVKLQPVMQAETGYEMGLLVLAVEPGSPADLEGIFIGDIFVRLARRALNTRDALVDVLNSDAVGQLVPLEVIRGGVMREVDIFLSPQR